MRGDWFRDALGKVAVDAAFNNEHEDDVGLAILAMPEMQGMLARVARHDEAVALWAKSVASLNAALITLTADLAAERSEVERLRTAGDALAEGRLKVCVLHPDPLVAAWEEARRER